MRCIGAFIQQIYAVDPNYKVNDVFEPMEQVVILAEDSKAQQKLKEVVVVDEVKKRDKKADLKLKEVISRVEALASSSDSSSDLEP